MSKTDKNGNLIIKNAAEIVTCSGFKAKSGSEMSDLHLIKDGNIVIEDGIITSLSSTDDDLKKLDMTDFTIIDASGRSVLPGFVDSHTHFIFGGYRAEEFSWRLRGDSYMEIMQRGGGINSTVAATRETSTKELITTGKRRLDSMLSFGVTTVEGKSGYGLDLETELRQLDAMHELDREHPVDIVPTFLGAHAIPPEYSGRSQEFIDFIIEKVLPKVAEKKLARFCDIFCEQGVFSIKQSRQLLTAAKQYGLQAKFHADEIVQLGGAELAAEIQAVSADHLLQASDQGMDQMAEQGVICTLLPGTAFSLKEPYAQGRKMIDKGCAVALATDLNPGSCFSESIPLIIALATLYMGLSTEEAITAFTLNGAAAVSLEKSTGSLDVGKQGDLILLEFPSYRFIPYHVGVNCVQQVIKKGVSVFPKA